MFTYNINNCTIPSYYLSKDNNYYKSYYLNNGWDGSIQSISNIPLLLVGNKYYKVINHDLVAFKVISIAVTYNFSFVVEINLADGTTKNEYIDSSFFKEIFVSIDNYKMYRMTNDRSYLYLDKTSKMEYLYEYINRGILNIVESFTINYLSIPSFHLDRNNFAQPSAIRFKYLWIDLDGLHYITFEKDINNCTTFISKKECLNSIKLMDFEDDENSVMKVSIPSNRTSEFVKLVEKFNGKII